MGYQQRKRGGMCKNDRYAGLRWRGGRRVRGIIIIGSNKIIKTSV